MIDHSLNEVEEVFASLSASDPGSQSGVARRPLTCHTFVAIILGCQLKIP